MIGWIPGALLFVGLVGCAAAANITATMHKIDASGVGDAVGTVTISGGSSGAVFAIELKGLPPGQHGFHVHTNADCRPGPNDQGQVVAGGAAGGHWDPEGTKQHQGPEGRGHLGDLPVFTVAADGTAKEQLTAPRMTDLNLLKGHALMIHAGGDNYADQPQPLGGGGARIACGVIQ
jgi:superoxide dismutase, Cu-Zn family